MAKQKIDELFDIPAIKTQVDTVFKYLDELAKRIDALNKLLNGMGGGGKGGSGGGGSKPGGSNPVGDAADELERALKRLAKAESDAGKAIAVVLEKLRQQNNQNRIAAKENIAASDSIDGMKAALARLTSAYDQMTAAQRKNKNEGRATVKQIQDLQKEIRKLELETGRAQRNVGNYPKQLVGGLTGLLGTFGVATGAGAIGKAIFDTTVRIDSLNSALRAVSKTEQEFAVNQKFLTDTSERLGLNILDLSQAYKLFYAASTQSGLSANTTREIFNSVAESAATLKLSTQDTQGVLLAFSQILGKGKVQAEELRGQIGERVPGAFKIAARSIGVTEQQLNKMLEKGEVIASEFLPKFARELEKTFGVNANESVDGLQASINRLSNSFTALVNDNQSGLNKFFSSIINFSREALEGFSSFIDVLGSGKGLVDAEGNSVDQRSPAKIEQDRQEALREALRKGNDAYIEEFKNASAERRKVLLDQAEKLERITAAEAEKALKGLGPIPNTVEGILDRTKKTGAADRAQDAAFQEADRARRFREIYLAENTKTEKVVTDAEKKKQANLRQMQLKAALEERNIDLEAAIKTQKEIAENEKLSIGERLQALANYNDLRTIYAEENAAAEKKILEEKVKINQAVAKDITNVDKKLAIERNEILKDTGKIQTEIVKQNVDGRIKILLDKSEKEKQNLQKQENDEISALRDKYENTTLTLEQYELAQLQIKNKYAVLALEEEIRITKEIIAIRKARGEDVSDLENAIANAEQKLFDLGFELFKKREKDKTKAAKKELSEREKQEEEFYDAVKKLAQETVNAIFEINNAQFENKKNALQDEMDANRKKEKEEIEAVNASVLSAEEKADRIAVINARAQAQENQLEARKRQIQMEQARFERAQAIAGIVLNTSLAVVKALAVAGPFSIPLALAVGALGAVQLATALATPLPRYFMGRDGGPAEWARVNDGGVKEVIERADGSAYVPSGYNVPVWLNEGDTVHSSVDKYIDSIGQGAHKVVPSMEVNSAGRLQFREDLHQQTKQLLAGMEKNKSTMVVQNTWAGVMISQESAFGFIKYLNKNVFK